MEWMQRGRLQTQIGTRLLLSACLLWGLHLSAWPEAEKVLPPMDTSPPQQEGSAPSLTPVAESPTANPQFPPSTSPPRTPSPHTVKKFSFGAMADVEYEPTSAIAVFPVVLHYNKKAFGDLSVLFADEFANALSKKAPETKVMNPVYTVEEIRLRGLSSVYSKLMDYYVKANRPESKALRYLLDELSTDDQPIQRVAFIEVDFDVNNTTEATGIVDRIKSAMTDTLPSKATYYVRTRIQVFDTSQESVPMIWATSRSKVVKDNKFFNVTPSVYQDSDSIYNFSQASRTMAREMFLLMPRKVYLIEQVPQMDVQGEVVK